ncbi:hypothetical protein MPH47_06115 [Psychrobacillus psychrodurans]|uniref:hypothetical protein n=1 Tax=Psychrobacillus psychrodurans TaxID=126157 RepID=UPI001F4D9455|nr:hypothetical protein [Psychrobacillus psychrodurans]MCK1996805.1 hypothetical protein [Psychrobacillus psychrodurans]
MSKTFKFNANETVKVRLYPAGIEILKYKHEELRKQIKKMNTHDIGEFKLNLSDDGYYSTQLWALIKDFGDSMNFGHDTPFNLNMIFVGGEVYVDETT